MEPSKPQVGQNRWRRPYVWLTGAAIGLALFSIAVAVGFVRGYVMLGSFFLTQYFAGQPLSPYTSFVIELTIASVIVPVIVSAGSAALLLLRKWLAGIYIGIAAIGAHFVMDAIYINYIWDGHHVVQSYTHATWLLRVVNEYGGYIESIYAFYLAYIPAMAVITLSLLIGWKKVR